MHELSIASSIVDIAIDKAKEHKADRITKIELEIGLLAGVIVEALVFCFDGVCKDTMASGAELSIVKIEGEGFCLECAYVFGISSLFSPCPRCKSYKVMVKKGKELKVKSIFVD